MAGSTVHRDADRTVCASTEPQLDGLSGRPAPRQILVAIGQEVDLLVCGADPAPRGVGLIFLVGAVDEQIGLGEEGSEGGPCAEVVEGVAGEDHHRQPGAPQPSRQGSEGLGLRERLAAEEGRALDSWSVCDLREQRCNGDLLSGPTGEVVGVAAARTAQRAALHPQRIAKPRPLGFSARNGAGEVDGGERGDVRSVV